LLSEKSAPSAALSQRLQKRITLIFGAPRSGTTWLAKIFDSHPDVLYRHEPDIVLRNELLPLHCRVEDLESYRDIAQTYLDRLIEIRTVKSAGSLPIFPKSYQTSKAYWLRFGIVYGLHLANLATGGRRWPNNVLISDFVDCAHRSPRAVVIKSVSARGRARMFAEARLGSRIIMMIRHPCGQVASMMRGIALGKLENPRISEILATDQAVRLGLSAQRLEALTLVEKLAWHWAILNQKAIDDLAGACSVRIVRYEDVVANPEGVARELFVFAGLAWHPQTAAFILKSSTYAGFERYHGVEKNSSSVANKWKKQLFSVDQSRILDIAGLVPVGQLFAKRGHTVAWHSRPRFDPVSHYELYSGQCEPFLAARPVER
jgi:hypothetical protein